MFGPCRIRPSSSCTFWLQHWRGTLFLGFLCNHCGLFCTILGKACQIWCWGCYSVYTFWIGASCWHLKGGIHPGTHLKGFGGLQFRKGTCLSALVWNFVSGLFEFRRRNSYRTTNLKVFQWKACSCSGSMGCWGVSWGWWEHVPSLGNPTCW